MNYGYISSQNQILTLQEQTDCLNEWALSQKMSFEHILKDEQLAVLKSGDFVVVNNMAVFGSDVCDAFSVIVDLLKKNIKIYSIDLNRELSGEKMLQAFQIALKADSYFQ